MLGWHLPDNEQTRKIKVRKGKDVLCPECDNKLIHTGLEVFHADSIYCCSKCGYDVTEILKNIFYFKE